MLYTCAARRWEKTLRNVLETELENYNRLELTVLDLVNLSSHLMASSGETLLFDKSMYPEVTGYKTNGEKKQQNAFWALEQDSYHTLVMLQIHMCIFLQA